MLEEESQRPETPAVCERSSKSIKVESIAKKIVMPPPPPVRKALAQLTSDEYNRIAYGITNRVLNMLIEFEADMVRIQAHPSLSNDEKSNLLNYINKKILTTIWCMEPGFILMGNFDRTKTFKMLYTRALNKGTPGLLEDKKLL
jgi:hypothetical protein